MEEQIVKIILTIDREKSVKVDAKGSEDGLLAGITIIVAEVAKAIGSDPYDVLKAVSGNLDKIVTYQVELK